VCVCVCVIQKQVPLPLPCVNFAQIAISSLTHRLNLILTALRLELRSAYLDTPVPAHQIIFVSIRRGKVLTPCKIQ